MRQARHSLNHNTARKQVYLRPVRQAHPTGCGIACVATLTGVPYAEVMDFLFGRFTWGPFYTSRRDMEATLSHYGIPRARKWRKRLPLTNPAVVAIDCTLSGGGCRYWHWVVFDGRRFFDPETGQFERWPLRRIRGWLAVEPPACVTPR